MESIGFKEWAAVCEALGRGRQSIIVRKGGIAEGREGFSFKHSEFFLFPTSFHEQGQKLRAAGPQLPKQQPGAIEISYAARIEFSETISSWDVAEALMPFHTLQPEVVRERFDYDAAPGLHVAFVRVYRLTPTWSFPNERRYGGCRSWVKLPDHPPEIQLEPVLAENEQKKRLREFRLIVRNCDPRALRPA